MSSYDTGWVAFQAVVQVDPIPENVLTANDPPILPWSNLSNALLPHEQAMLLTPAERCYVQLNGSRSAKDLRFFSPALPPDIPDHFLPYEVEFRLNSWGSSNLVRYQDFRLTTGNTSNGVGILQDINFVPPPDVTDNGDGTTTTSFEPTQLWGGSSADAVFATRSSGIKMIVKEPVLAFTDIRTADLSGLGVSVSTRVFSTKSTLRNAAVWAPMVRIKLASRLRVGANTVDGVFYGVQPAPSVFIGTHRVV